jgi:hypothetical protein
MLTFWSIFLILLLLPILLKTLWRSSTLASFSKNAHGKPPMMTLKNMIQWDRYSPGAPMSAGHWGNRPMREKEILRSIWVKIYWNISTIRYWLKKLKATPHMKSFGLF